MKSLRNPIFTSPNSLGYFIVGALLAMPGLEIAGVSISYFPSFIAFLLMPKYISIIPRMIITTFVLAFISFTFEIFNPTTLIYMNSRYRSVTNQINTKFATSIQSENTVLWFKFSTALIGGTLIALLAYSRSLEHIVIKGFLSGSVVSVLVGILTLKPGEGSFVQSIGLGRTNTTFGMICSFSISLVFIGFSSRRNQLFMVVIFLSGSLVSGSRGAALTSMVALFFNLVWSQGASKLITSIWSILAAVLFLMEYGHEFLSRIGFRALTPNSSISNSDFIREQLRQQAILDWNRDPLGGVGFSVLTQGHNTYLQTLAAGGILLFCGYLLIDLNLVWRVIMAQKRIHGGFLLSLTFCTVFNHLTQNQIDVPFLYFVVAIIFIECEYATQGGGRH